MPVRDIADLPLHRFGQLHGLIDPYLGRLLEGPKKVLDEELAVSPHPNGYVQVRVPLLEVLQAFKGVLQRVSLRFVVREALSVVGSTANQLLAF